MSQVLRCHRPRRRAIQYSRDSSVSSRSRGILDARLRGHDRCVCVGVLATQIVRAIQFDRPRKYRGRREGRVLAHTHGPRAEKKHAAEPQVRAEHPAFPAQWLYGLYVISPGTGSLAPVARALVAPQAWHQHRDARTTRLRRAYRLFVRATNHAATRHAHRIPLPTSVTIAIRPSYGGGTGGSIDLICPTTQAIMPATK